ncbi:2-dehydro-3-deoxy-6-phosphogalactonate aldolase [Oxalobacteraceae bacterium R-40]|uniref:2-dehydro-3-deoxy-6-phosphogalactonate aldolase n=1 Tax=Keguizhuia sedimenti TaxID=3064264 RepID=A0ABU1BRA1_9BURK|nr:2-dehydro-3-deoxy-6-phosphogalactonate aldolase [Oxalobacteraceae bacterium R-40]
MFDLQTYPCPLVAILRGLSPADAVGVARILFDAGFRMLEVPLNRPGALEAIRSIRNIAPHDSIVGGGTMLTEKDVDAVFEAGGRLMVSPNCEPDVIRHAVHKGMLALPGVATPTEAFRALDAGAHGLKLFPAEMIPPSVVKAMRSVLPSHIHVMPVGGVNPNNMKAYFEAGATGFGIGSQLYQPGMEAEDVRKSAAAFMQARQALL